MTASAQAEPLDIYSSAIALSLLVYVVVGNLAGRGVKGLDDYYVGGRRAPTFLIVGTLVASLMSSSMFLGEVGFAYDGQAGPYVLFPQMACAGYVLGALLFGRYLRRSRATTVAEYFGARFASSRIQQLAGMTVIFALGGYLLAVTQGGAIVLEEITELDYREALVIAWLSYTGFTVYSGSRGVLMTDTLMFLLFATVSLWSIAWMVDALGGWPYVLETLVDLESKPDLMSWHGIVGPGTEWPTATDYLIWAVIIDTSWLLVYAISPWQSSRHLMARNEHVVLRSAICACVAVAILQVAIYSMGGVINVASPDIEPYDRATIWASLNVLPPLLGALMLSGIIAAALSSASTFMTLVSFSITRDLGLSDHLSESTTLRLSRIMMFAVGAAVLVVALFVPADIFWLMIFIGTVFASAWGPVGLMSIWSDRITEPAAFWGMLTGLVGNVLPKLLEVTGVIALPAYADPALLGFAASLFVIIVISRRTERREVERAYLEHLHSTPADELDEAMLRTTLRLPWALIAINAILMPVLLGVFYVYPYQRATGATLGGMLDPFTGEFALLVSWFLIYGVVGFVALRMIRASYGSGAAPQAPRRGDD